MKRILAILISVLLLMNMTVVVFAQDDITMNVAFDNENRAFTITGHIKYERDRLPVLLFMTQGSDIVAIAETVAKGREEAGIPFVFSDVKIKSTTGTGDISIVVTVAEKNFVASDSYYYLGVDSQFAALNTLKSVIQSGDYDTLKAAVSGTKSELGVDDSLLINLSDKAARIAMNNLFLLEIAEITGYATDDEIALINEEVKKYQKQYKEAIALGTYFNSSSSAALKSWYDANKAEYNLLLDDAQTAVDETKLLDYFDQAIALEDFSLRADNITFVKTMKELNVEMKKQAVLQIVEISNQNAVLHIISNLSALLSNVPDANGQNPISVNYADWNGMNEDQKTAVCINIAGNNYKNIYDFVSAVNSQIALNKNTAQTGSPVIGGNTGGRGDKKGNSEVLIPVPSQNETVDAISFKDIDNVKWAEDAIYYLHATNVVSGKDAYTFAPNDKVTRAELAKMLVLGFNLKGDGAISFNDVNSSAWYAEYVKIAAANGLIKGDENGNFNPNEPVSRQDAAVMMYRAIGSTSKADKAYFVDYSEISPYAQDAVDYMCANGVINGIGNGVFAPFANLTRAQSAKMIYGLLVR